MPLPSRYLMEKVELTRGKDNYGFMTKLMRTGSKKTPINFIHPTPRIFSHNAR
jgi:hypothetical protein